MLFLCTGNSARSQMAEALAEQLSAARCARSAGSHPKPLHPNAVRVMRDRGIDIAGRRSKHLDEFAAPAVRLRGQPLRPRARGLPGVPGAPELDPLEHPRPGARRTTPAAFERTAAELASRIPFLLERHRGGELNMPDDLVSVRYMVDDVDAAVDFYTTPLRLRAAH